MEILLEKSGIDAIETYVSRLACKLYLKSQLNYVVEARQPCHSDLMYDKYERFHVMCHRTVMFSVLVYNSNRH
jgi:hypothetical protein